MMLRLLKYNVEQKRSRPSINSQVRRVSASNMDVGSHPPNAHALVRTFMARAMHYVFLHPLEVDIAELLYTATSS